MVITAIWFGSSCIYARVRALSSGSIFVMSLHRLYFLSQATDEVFQHADELL